MSTRQTTVFWAEAAWTAVFTLLPALSCWQNCRTLGGCATGDAKRTAAYRLPCKFVIHTVGPRWHGGSRGEREKLVSCYRTSLELAAEAGCRSVAFPLISAGVYGYPKAPALSVAVEAILDFLKGRDMEVLLVLFNSELYQMAQEQYPALCTDIFSTEKEKNV